MSVFFILCMTVTGEVWKFARLHGHLASYGFLDVVGGGS